MLGPGPRFECCNVFEVLGIVAAVALGVHSVVDVACDTEEGSVGEGIGNGGAGNGRAVLCGRTAPSYKFELSAR